MDTSKKKNRPDMRDLIPRSVMFHETGSTWWRRRRNLGDYKGNKQEGDFSHLHGRFVGPEDAA